MKVAIVGLGKMGLLHASLLSTLPNVQVMIICEKSGLIRKVASKVLDINMVDSVEKIKGIDAVYVTTPPSSHYQIIKELYIRGISNNIFVEKPLTVNYDNSYELASSFSYVHKGVNMVGYNRRFSVTFKKAKQILDCGVLGEVEKFEGYAYSSDYVGKEIPESLRKIGVMRDMGCHVIDLALWFFGSLEKGSISASWQKEGYRLPEIGLHIYGSKGELVVNDDKVVLGEQVWHKQDLNDNVLFYLGGSDYLREDVEFTNAVMYGNKVESNFQSASDVDYEIRRIKNVEVSR